jgi:exocyst complex protein 7
MISIHDSEKKNSLRSRLTENLFNSPIDQMKRRPIRNGTQNILSDTVNNGNNGNTTVAVSQVHDFETTECVKFVQCVRKVLNLFKIENNFIEKVIESNSNDNKKVITSKILNKIFDPVFRYLFNDAEKFAANARQITNKCTSKFVIALFRILSDLAEMKEPFLAVFEQSTLNTKAVKHLSPSTQRLLELFIIFEKACAQCLKDIIDEIKKPDQTVQPNGNIHSITTETITFIENLMQFDLIAGIVANVIVGENQNQILPSEHEIKLRKEASAQDAKTFSKITYRETSEEKLVFRTALAEYFYKLFRWLNLNLKNKAEIYETKYFDPNLKWIFLLNNSFKISKLFINNNLLKQPKINNGNHKCKCLNELFAMSNSERDLKTFYEKEILTYKREYSKCWSRLLDYISDLNANNPFDSVNKLKEKERQLLKDRFSGFNKEFEEIYETQKKYYIPAEQAELAKMLREDNTVYIISQYKRFYDVYGAIGFATNKNKYVKYEPDVLAARIREFFTAY